MDAEFLLRQSVLRPKLLPSCPHNCSEVIECGMREIPLTQGFVAWVDDDDFERLIAFKWHTYSRDGATFYAYSHRLIPREFRTSPEKRYERLIMHRLVMNAPAGIEVDHVIHRRGEMVVDNRKSNLRLATRVEQVRNRRKSRGMNSVFKGVGRSNDGWRWQSQITHSGRRLHLGYFRNEAHAALAYDLAAVRLFGEFALTNFPVPGSPQALFDAGEPE